MNIRRVVQADLPVFFEQQIDPEGNRMSAVGPRQRGDFDAHWTKILADPSIAIRTIEQDGRVAGYVGCFHRDGRLEVMYWLGRAFWGQGIASGALSTFLAEETRRPILARIAKRNPASIRVVEKCGFKRTGEDIFTNRAGESVEEYLYEL
jgi:RimJ/RimL family protein N-acetyltransferase